jgi:DNA-binding PadR family transcriptional regulator
MCYYISTIIERGVQMSITADLIRGHTDTIILAKLMERDSYGYEINKAVYNASNQLYELKEATLYTAFKRLEDAGCISSYWGDQSTGARRKYYTITELGKQTYKQKIDEWLEAKRLLDTLLHTEG